MPPRSAFRGNGDRRGGRRGGGGGCASKGLISGSRAYVHDVPHSHRSGRRVEPLISLQWFCDMDGPRQARDRGGAKRRYHLPPEGPLDARVPELAREHPALDDLPAALVGPPAAGLVSRRRDLRGATGREPGRRGGGSAIRTCSTPGFLVRPRAVRARRGGRRATDELRAFYPTDLQLHGARHHLPLGRADGHVREKS